jgi:tetratricopeptide (TPR) repeat protein
MCRGAAQKLVGVWDPERRRAVHGALIATQKSFAESSFLAAARALDQYASAWTAAHTDACAATRMRGEQSEEVMELRIECLDRRREEVRALVDVLAHADAQVAQRAPQAVDSLPGLDECKHADALRQVVPPPATREAHQRVAALRIRLAEATARRNAGQYAEGLKLAESIIAEARQLAYAPVLAEALILRGNLEGDTGNETAAINTLVDAGVAAESGRHDRMRAEALMRLVTVVGSQARFAEAHSYARLGRAAILRAGGDPNFELKLELHEADVLTGEGRYDEAVALQRQVLPRLEQLRGPEAPDVAILLNNMGRAYKEKGDPRRAIPLHQRAISIYEKAYGTGHPMVAFAWNNVGTALLDERDYRGAIAAFERALTIKEAALSPGHPSVAATLGNMGVTVVNLGQPERALMLVERAHALVVRALGPEHKLVATTECQQAEVLLQLRRTEAAHSHIARCLAIRERALGADHPFTAQALMLEGRYRLAQGNGIGAIQPLERAIAVFNHHPGVKDDMTTAQFTLAQALWDTGRDRRRARSLAQAARQWGPIRSEVDAWLAKHR